VIHLGIALIVIAIILALVLHAPYVGLLAIAGLILVVLGALGIGGGRGL
jgi:hypothetical protein